MLSKQTSLPAQGAKAARRASPYALRALPDCTRRKTSPSETQSKLTSSRPFMAFLCRAAKKDEPKSPLSSWSKNTKAHCARSSPLMRRMVSASVRTPELLSLTVCGFGGPKINT